MKIALIVRKYQLSGGTERFTYNLSKFLSQKVDNVTIVCNKADIEPPYKNIKILKLPSLNITRTFKTLFFNYMVNSAVNLKDFDIVQGCGKITNQDVYRAGGGFHKLYLQKEGGVRSKFNVYDKIVTNIEKKIYDPLNTKYVIAVSHYIAEKINQEFDYPLERVKVFHNCVDTSIFNTSKREIHKKEMMERFSIPEKTVIFSFVATNFKLKGLPLILDVLANYDNYRLFVAGGDNFDKIISKYDHKVKQKVIFTGEQRGDDLLKIYHAADVLLHPTFFDPFANVCLEAMACGAPIVTTAINGVSEIIDNYKDGIIISDANDREAFEKAVRMFIEKPDIIKEFSSNSLIKIKNYTFDRYTDNLLEFYRDIISEKFLNR